MGRKLTTKEVLERLRTETDTAFTSPVLSKYLYGEETGRTPTLPHSVVKVGNRYKNEFDDDEVTAFIEAYNAKVPFGSKLHKSRVR